VAVVAPASPAPWTELGAGLAWLAGRYRVVTSGRIYARAGYLAGSDDDRAAELGAAFRRTDVAAIVCARGGYGALRILDRLPWDALLDAPKWLVGFSDVTALHLEASRRGLATLHGANVTGLGRPSAGAPLTRSTWLRALEGRPRAPFQELVPLRDGAARGPVVGGNLTLVASLAAAGRLALPRGSILVLEDVTERPYRIDRMLTSLRLGGHLDALGGIVFGEFDACAPGPDGVTVDDVLRDFGAHVKVPVFTGAPFGHGARNEALVLGAEGTLTDRTLRFG
jgi:muramoyltetrapeptide carboxypeptidase